MADAPDHTPPAVDQPEPNALVDAVVQVSFDLMSLLTELGAADDLSLTQLRVLGILRDREPMLSELADHLGLDRSTVSGLVDRAARRGLVERVANPDDRRSSRVRLTDAGQRLAARLTAEIGSRVADMLAEVDADERDVLRELLERIPRPFAADDGR